MSLAKFYDVTLLAQFCAELVRQGVTFEVRPLYDAGEGYGVHFTGGF